MGLLWLSEPRIHLRSSEYHAFCGVPQGEGVQEIPVGKLGEPGGIHYIGQISCYVRTPLPSAFHDAWVCSSRLGMSCFLLRD